MAKAAHDHSRRDDLLRGWANLLGCWRVCDNDSCRQARVCRGNIRACAPRNFSRLPEGVQDFCAGLLWLRERRVGFDAAIERLAETPALAAFNEWTAGRPDEAERNPGA
jgi:hypothetical protein